MSDFWSKDFTAGGIADPKRKFRFLVSIAGITGTDSGTSSTVWYAKTATKPSFSVATTEHKYLNHTFYYPGTVTWNDVTITLVDPTDPSVASIFGEIMLNSGYGVPADENSWHTLTKAGMSSALGKVVVTQINGVGEDLESWELKNPIITEMKFGDLEYGADDLTELTLTMKYDWATMTDGESTVAFAAQSRAPGATTMV